MKEFEELININGGLRKFKSAQRNSGGLLECHNLMPMEEGYEIHEVVIDLNATGVTWDGLGQVAEAS